MVIARLSPSLVAPDCERAESFKARDLEQTLRPSAMESVFLAGTKSMSKLVFLLLLLSCLSFTSAAAYKSRDPNGNVTIKWDVMSWTPDGYVAIVTMSNFQKYRGIPAPGWQLGWTWAKKEVIWNMFGAQTTMQGDCSRFKGNIPHSCRKDPVVVDLLPGTPYSQQIANCCKAGVLLPWHKDQEASISAFQLAVGVSGNSNRTVKLPRNFNLLGPGHGYTCGSAKVVPSTKFITPDHKRVTQALMTWVVTCTYSTSIRSEKS